MAFYFYNGSVPGCVRLKDINTYAGCSIEADVRASDVLVGINMNALLQLHLSKKGKESQAFRSLLFNRSIGLRLELSQIFQMLSSPSYSPNVFGALKWAVPSLQVKFDF